MSAARPTILIMAGGTGGHIFPALAVARELADAGWAIVWLGTPAGMENRLVPAAGYPLRLLSFFGGGGKGLLRWLLLPGRLLLAFVQALRILRREHPDVVLGMGGYPSLPGGLMASLLNKPLIIHEQNAVAGLANRILAQVADRVLIAFDGAFERGQGRWLKPAGTETVGNPIRREIGEAPSPDARYAARVGPLKLLVVGGSLGATALNRIVPESLARLPQNQRFAVVHQTGEGRQEEVAARYRALGLCAEVHPFLADMAGHYRDADLVICRSGALTVAELAAAGVAALFVPFPHAVDDHQTENARSLQIAGAALLLPQSTLTVESLADTLIGLDRKKLHDMACRARQLARPEAARSVANICMDAAARREAQHVQAKKTSPGACRS
jgi:UDP-N-acetylglucosamine--N-acetylmuramyl-(pentapeptide) pyrophosphoryl-undecaprenol N-acetylglucosamine transferase